MKPLIFISHSHYDDKIVDTIQHWINDNLLSSVDFFISNDDNYLKIGSRWFESISKALSSASSAIILVTPKSINSSWIYYEAGATSIRDIPLIPICANGIDKNQLPSPLNQYQAIDIYSEKGQRALIKSIANQAGLSAPNKLFPLKITALPDIFTKNFDWKNIGFLEANSHAEAYNEFFVRIEDKKNPPKKMLLSGASLTEIVHVNTMSLVQLANIGCEEIKIIIKEPDHSWSDNTSVGMSFIPPAYSSNDSFDMCKQSLSDLKKAIVLTKNSPCTIEGKTCNWPPTYIFALLEYENYSWGFVELVQHSLTLSDRNCFIVYISPQNEQSSILNKFLKSFNGLWNDSVALR